MKSKEGLWRLVDQMKMGRQWILANEEESGYNDGVGEGTTQLVGETSKWIGLKY